MIYVFADTGYWVALIDPDDDIHLKAVSASNQLGKVTIVTHELVLVEVLNHFAGYGAFYRRKAVENVERTLHHPGTLVVNMESERFRQAMLRYSRYYDKAWGLTDCYSFTLMDDMGITDALAYDHHFQQAGFRALLREA